jgi:hypothetical protein
MCLVVKNLNGRVNLSSRPGPQPDQKKGRQAAGAEQADVPVPRLMGAVAITDLPERGALTKPTA